MYYNFDQIFDAYSRYFFSTLAHLSWSQNVLILEAKPTVNCDSICSSCVSVHPPSDLSLFIVYYLDQTSTIIYNVGYLHCAIDDVYFLLLFCVSCETGLMHFFGGDT